MSSADVPMQPVRHPLELKEQGYDLYKQGKRLEEIATALHIPFSTLAKWSSVGRWKHKRADWQAGVSTRLEIGRIPASKRLRAEGQVFEEKQARYTEAMSDEALRIAETIAALPAEALLHNANRIKDLDSTARKALKLEDSKPSTVIQVAFLQRSIEAQTVPILSLDSARTYETNVGSLPVSTPSEGCPVAPGGAL